MKCTRELCLAAAAGALVICGQAARAESVLGIDLNGFTVGITAPTGGGAGTRTLDLSGDGNTFIAAITIDGDWQEMDPEDGTITGWDGTITTTGSATEGTVTGSFVLTDAAGRTYSVAGLVGTYDTFGSQVLIEATTFGGQFSSPVFEGVNVSAFDAGEPLSGSLFQFALNPTRFRNGGNDWDVNGEMTAVVNTVPIPAAAWGGVTLIGLIGTNHIRRRRKEVL
jgi:hypothetical protein